MVDLVAVCLEVEGICWYSSMMARHVLTLEIAMMAIPWMVFPSLAG